MFIKESTKYELQKETVKHKAYEGLLVKIGLENSTCLVGVVYRPPGRSMVEFNVEIEELLLHITKGTKNLILIGDFNIDLLKINEHKETNAFYNCLTSHQLIPTITRPTRITTDTSTLIENIFTNAWSRLIETSIII